MVPQYLIIVAVLICLKTVAGWVGASSAF